MSPSQLRQIEETYFRIVSLPEHERASALESARDLVPGVLAEVRSLLEHGAVPRDFLAAPAIGGGLVLALAGPLQDQADSLVGVRVGPYRIERLIGAGGMGAVYLGARADGAFEQRVAIKVVKRGMDTDEILRRFHDERRTLANLRHPHIATLFDGGSLADGRPYLVMEYVDGAAIDNYCRDRGLRTAERLRLFVEVCRAVQFAHQNLVIHRDLKPGNIFITADGTPKLLDFGISKVLDSGPEAIVTGIEERRLTPEYAAPEQVDGRAITTAADVYSLGVILYELLSGQRPYEFTTRTTAEIQRIVTGSSPAPPSIAAERAAPSAAAPRARELRGDPDNIVLTAMRKEPERRYPSAAELAADIDRHLRGLPVAARGETPLYLLSKFVKRHALACTAAIIVALLLGAGTVAIAVAFQRAREQRDQAFVARDQAEAIAKFLHDALASADPTSEHPRATVRELLDEAAARVGAELTQSPLVQAELRSTIGTAYLNLGALDQAEKLLRESYQQRLALQGPDGHDVAESKWELASLLYARQSFPESETLLREAEATFRRIRGDHNEDIAKVLNSLGAVLRSQGKIDDAADALAQAAQIRRAQSGPRSLLVAETLNNLAGVLRAQNKLAEAENTMTEALGIRRELLGEDHALVAQSTANLAVMIHARGDLDRAEPLYRRALELELKSLGPDHPGHAITLNSLAALLRSKHDAAGAEPLLREAVRIRRTAMPPLDPRRLSVELAYADVLAELGRVAEAREQYQSLISDSNAPDCDPSWRQRALEHAAEFFTKTGDASTAQQIRARLLPTPAP